MISVVIPSYNRRDSMLELLANVSAQEEVEFEIIVVDDQSPDDSVEAIRNAFPKVRLFVNEKNGGPAVTRNKGIKEAKGDIIVGFDSDVTVPDRFCLKKVAATFAELPQASGLAFRLLQPDETSEDYARWWHPVPIEKWANQRFKTDYFSGTGYAFRTATLREAGMYPEILYMHYEEVELAFRILDLGGDIIYCPNITVIHHEGQVSRRSEIKEFYKHRNQWLITIACYPFFRGIGYILPRTVFQFLTAIRNRHLGSYFRALSSARKLGSIRFTDRKPLRNETFHRIKSFSKGCSL
ncbi:glycosyl transferase, group 2 family protein [Verrucomicrobiia bacterium DG1235]|nr:glycosyl transferase, group 2 family protein [Verrucomicrobiae bacterium DG1235]